MAIVKARALKSFRMKQTLVRIGDIFEAEEEYMRDIARNGFVAFIQDFEDDEFVEEAPKPLTKKAAKGGKAKK